MTSIWLCRKDGQRASTHERSLSDSGKLSTALNRLHGYGTTISMALYCHLGSHSPQPIPTSISAASVFWYCYMWTISPCHVRMPPPKPWSRPSQSSRRYIGSRTSGRHTNSSALRSTAITLVPESVLVRKPISPQSSDDLAWSIVTVSWRPWIAM